ncbi:hypothetical protein TNCV_152251 [Trichonephila clavipes]|uniref:Uncharacterized protein n=1 Tax=Trichonephila clavipes TaxID=2585209 RepID=A0A8X6V515_TRICX|nr:hypothetical protein TNCV_152251 [Trichonephila clavipes]
MRAKAYYARFSLRDLVPEVHEHIFRSGMVSLLPKPPALSSQASLIIIHRPTEEMKKLSQPCPDRRLNLVPVLLSLSLTQWSDNPREPRPNMPASVYVALCPEVHEQMFRSNSQSIAKTTSSKFPSKLDNHSSTH